jgi:hypothetical protein
MNAVEFRAAGRAGQVGVLLGLLRGCRSVEPAAASGNNKEEAMARWQPRTPKESLEASLERLKARIDGKKSEIKELEDQRKQVEQAIKALSAA